MAKKTGIIKLAGWNKLPIMKGLINDKEAYFIMDSGASISVMNLNDAEEFGFRVEETEDGAAAGYGGTANFQKAAAITIETQDKIELWVPEFKAQDLSKIVDVIERNEGFKINGILGFDLMKRYSFILNFKDNTMNFTY
jgi:hypothetical protein